MSNYKSLTPFLDPVSLVLVGSGLLFLQAFDAFAFEGRDEAAVAGVAGGWLPAAVLPLVDEVGFVDQGAAEGN